MDQAERIREEGARYNLGNMRSTLGNPVLALGVLQQSYQPRFRFSLGNDDKSVGAGVAVVEYKESQSPAMIRGEAGDDLPAHGRLWIDIATGRVLKTELQVEQPAVRAIITTTFQAEEKSGIAVPLEMREQYTFPNGNRVNTVATYGRFRRFDVNANEDIQHADRDDHRRVDRDDVRRAAAGTVHDGQRGGRSRAQRRRGAARRRDHAAVPDRPARGDAAGVAHGDGHRAEPLRRLRTALSGRERHLLDVQKFLEKLNAHPPQTLRLPAADRSGVGIRVPRADHRTVLDRRESDDRAGELQRHASRTDRFPPASSGRRRRRPARFRSTRGASPTCTATCGSGRRTGTVRIRRRAAANIDPHGPASGEKRVIRGGSWFFDANSARCALRYTHAPQDKGFSLGFRVAADRPR